MAQFQVCLIVIGGEFSGKMEIDLFFFSESRLVLLASCTTMCTITTKQHNCWVLVFKWNIHHVRASSALFTVAKIKIIVDWKLNILFVWACWTIHISSVILNWIFRFFRTLNPFTKLKKKNWFVLQKEYCAPDTWNRIEDIDSRFWWENGKCFCGGKYIRTHCGRRIHVPNRINFAIVVPRNSGKCTTHRISPQLFLTCLQHDTGSWGSGEIRDG